MFPMHQHVKIDWDLFQALVMYFLHACMGFKYINCIWNYSTLSVMTTLFRHSNHLALEKYLYITKFIELVKHANTKHVFVN